MTPEDEEFNRIEMESRIKQQYVRQMLTKPDQMVAMADYLNIMEQLAYAKVQIRELQERIAKLEGK